MKENIPKILAHLEGFGLASKAYERILFDKGTQIPIRDRGLYLIEAGEVGVEKICPCGKSVLMNILVEGDLINVISKYKEELLDTFLIALLPTSTTWIDEETFYTILNKDKALMIDYIAYLQKKILFLNKKSALISKDNIKPLVKDYLKHGQIQGKSFTKVKLCQYLDISRASLYRIIQEIEDEI